MPRGIGCKMTVHGLLKINSNILSNLDRPLDPPLTDTPAKCECGTRFSVEHALSCPRGAFPIIRYNEVRDFTVSLLTEVCHNVKVEPELQPLTNEQFVSRAMNGFCGGTFEIFE